MYRLATSLAPQKAAMRARRIVSRRAAPPLLLASTHGARPQAASVRSSNSSPSVGQRRSTSVRTSPPPQQAQFKVSVAGKRVGKLTVQLHDEQAPKTVEAFRKMCSPQSEINRIIPNFFVQCGELDADGKVHEEAVRLRHSEPGLLSTNGKEVFFTTAPSPWLDGAFVPFGKVTKGMEVLREIESIPTFQDAPMKPVVLEASF